MVERKCRSEEEENEAKNVVERRIRKACSEAKCIFGSEMHGIFENAIGVLL